MDVEKIRKDFPALGCELRGKPIVYLDNACMTLKSRQVIDAMMQYYECFPACAGRSVHKLSTMVEEHCHSARKRVAKFLDAKSEREIVFTRNTTEGINLVAHALGFRKGDVVVTSDREHNSNLLPWHALRDRAGIVHRVVKSNEDGTFSMENFRKEVKTNMENEYSDYVYSVRDLDQAFNIGLQSSVYILEKSVGLTPEGLQLMIEGLKKMIDQSEVIAIMSDTVLQHQAPA